MPRIDWTRVLVIQLSLLASIVLLVIAWHALLALVHTLLLFAAAALLAFVLAPIVDRGEERGLPRLAAVALVYVTFAVVLVLAGALLAQPFVNQATLLIENMPRYVTNVQQQLLVIDRWLAERGLGTGDGGLQAEAGRQIYSAGTAFLADLVRILTHVASSALDTVLVLVVSFYLLLDGPRLRAALLAVVPAAHHGKLLFVETSLGRVVGGYLRGQVLMAVTLAIVVGIGMQALGMPYAIVLAVLAGVFELIPMLGPILSALPALAVALFQPFPMVLWVLAFFVVVQQIEAHVLAPRITGHAVGLHPLGAIFALLAGLELGGPLGAIVAVPLVGFLWVIATTLYRRTIDAPEPPPRPGWRLPGRRPQPPPDGPLTRSATAEPAAPATSPPPAGDPPL